MASLKNDFTIGGKQYVAGSRSAQGSYVRGDKEAMKKFRRVKDNIENKAIKTSTRKAGSLVLKAARKNARPVSRIIARALGQKVKFYKKDGVGIAVIGVRDQESVRQKNKAGRLHDPRNTIHLVELGTQPHMIPLYGNKAVLVRHPGTKPQNILARAIAEKMNAAKMEYEITFKRVIDGTK